MTETRQESAPHQSEEEALERLASNRIPAGVIVSGDAAHDDVIERFGPDAPPAVVLVHGGYWRPDIDRGYLRPLAQALAQQGIPVWLVEYPRHPGRPDDTVDVLRRVREQSGNAVWIGHSAGGQLALLIAGDAPTISLAGVTDLERAAERDLGDGAAAAFVGRPLDDASRAEYQKLNPVQQGFPPQTLLIHGDADGLVPVDFSRDAADWIGRHVDYVPLHGAHHMDVVDPQSPYFPTVSASIQAMLRRGGE